MAKMTFPKNFLWGASSAAHQVEADLVNDWKTWEEENAQSLAENFKEIYLRGSKYIHQVPDFDTFADQASDPNNYISGTTVDFRRHYKEDLKLAKSLGHNSFRFSIAWEDVNPEKGVFNDKALEFYKELTTYMHELGIEPVVTLWHYTLPVWFARQGGWRHRHSADYYEKYVKYLIKSGILDSIKYIITVNEPMAYLTFAYIGGTRPPQTKSLLEFRKARKNIITAHKKAFKILKSVNSNLQISVAKAVIYFEVTNRNPINLAIKKFADSFFNYSFLDSIAKELDFIGLNYYFHNRINFGINKYTNPKTSDMGWGLYPKGLYQLIKDLQKYKLPIIITEHGLADKDDKYRSWYIEESLKYIEQAIDEGIDVRGYLHWSLTDNFEWDYGSWPRFGLIEVDYNTQKRKVRKSAYRYRELIEKYS